MPSGEAMKPILPPLPRPTRAFTLIEVVVALGLGLIVVLTLYAVFRSVVSATAYTSRLARENQLLRAGMQGGLEEVDFWTAQDDPDHPPLRDGAGDPGEQLGRASATQPGVAEPFNDLDGDGHRDVREPFTNLPGGSSLWDPGEWFYDADGDGHWDNTETYTDSNANGQFDNGRLGEHTATRLGLPFTPFADLVDTDDGVAGKTPGPGATTTNSYPLVAQNGEPFCDVNGNGSWDGEVFTDGNGNGRWDPGEPWTELNGNGVRDPDEPFGDQDGDGLYDGPEAFTDGNGNGVWDAEPFMDLNGNGVCDRGLAQPVHDPLWDARGARKPAVLESGAPTRPLLAPVPDAEFARGWDPALHWSPADERIWFRGDHGEMRDNSRSDHRFGRYAAYGSHKVLPELGDPTFSRIQAGATWAVVPKWNQGGNGGGPLIAPPGYPWTTTGPYGQVETRHTWRENQVSAIRYALGWWGLVDYMPASLIMGSYGGMFADPRTGTWVDVDEASPRAWEPFGLYAQQLFRVNKNEGIILIARSSLAYYYDSAPRLQQGGAPIATTPVPTVALWERKTWDMGKATDTSVGGMTGAMFTATVVRPLLPQRPEDWPEVTAEVCRYLIAGHLNTAVAIRITDPVNGDWRQLDFNAWGSNLRGARQQRHRDGSRGWARWLGAGDPAAPPATWGLYRRAWGDGAAQNSPHLDVHQENVWRLP